MAKCGKEKKQKPIDKPAEKGKKRNGDERVPETGTENGQ